METSPSKDKVVIQSVPSWTWIVLFTICLLIILVGWISSCNKEGKVTKSEGNKTTFLEFITPCQIVADYEFFLESDDSIAQKFPGISEVIIYSGRGKSEVPKGRLKGPIKFFYPSDSSNGHKSFRIYPVK